MQVGEPCAGVVELLVVNVFVGVGVGVGGPARAPSRSVETDARDRLQFVCGQSNVEAEGPCRRAQHDDDDDDDGSVMQLLMICNFSVGHGHRQIEESSA